MHAKIEYHASGGLSGGDVEFVYGAGFGESADMHMVTNDEKTRYGLNITLPQKAQMKTDISGNGSYEYSANNHKHYIGGKYGLAIIDFTNVRSQDKGLKGQYGVTVTYRNESGNEFTYSGTAAPLSYEVTN